MVFEIKYKNKIEKEIVTMLSWRKAIEKPHAALPLAPIFCFASQPYHYPLLLQIDLEVFIRATIPNTS